MESRLSLQVEYRLVKQSMVLLNKSLVVHSKSLRTAAFARCMLISLGTYFSMASHTRPKVWETGLAVMFSLDEVVIGTLGSNCKEYAIVSTICVSQFSRKSF